MLFDLVKWMVMYVLIFVKWTEMGVGANVLFLKLGVKIASL